MLHFLGLVSKSESRLHLSSLSYIACRHCRGVHIVWSKVRLVSLYPGEPQTQESSPWQSTGLSFSSFVSFIMNLSGCYHQPVNKEGLHSSPLLGRWLWMSASHVVGMLLAHVSCGSRSLSLAGHPPLRSASLCCHKYIWVSLHHYQSLKW